MSLSLASREIQGHTPMLGASRSPFAVRETVPHIVVALECDRPLAGASRHSLAQIDTVLLGRGARRLASRAQGSRELRLEVPDAWLSAAHARLVRRDGQWWIADALSTNGTRVNGRPCAEACLQDGDLIQAGRTLFWFRQVASQDGAEDDDGLTLEGAGLATVAASMSAAVAALPRIARSALPVVIAGESGTGKELVARAIHALSLRTGPFQAVNCAAIPMTLLESELFGARKGAFSGAAEDRPGLVRAADRGTLLLDEVADLAAPAQAALLRFLQESEVLPVGATRPIRVDVRVVAAAQADLRSLVAEGRFRADLFARLDAFTVRLPPLRERREDIGLLVAALLRKLAPERCEELRISPEAALALFRHSWPLNVRELEHSLAVALTVGRDTTIEADHLPEGIRVGRSELVPGGDGDRDRFREELLALLQRYRGNVAEVARAFGKGRMQIHRWARRYDIDLASFRR